MTTERFSTTNDVRLYAHALSDEYDRASDQYAEEEVPGMTTSYVDWYDAHENANCVLRRDQDLEGSDFILQLMKLNDGFGEEVDFAPTEGYRLSYRHPQMVEVINEDEDMVESVDLDSPVGRRVIELLARIEPDSELLYKRQEDDEAFRRIVGVYVLSGEGVERSLAAIQKKKRGSRLPHMKILAAQLARAEELLTQDDIERAMHRFYSNRHRHQRTSLKRKESS